MSKNPPPVTAFTTKSAAQLKRALLLSLLSLIIALCAIGSAFFIWQQSVSDSGGMTHNVAALQKNLEENKLAFQASLQDLQKQTADMQKTLIQNQTSIAQVMAMTSSRRRVRALSQIAYLLHVANLHLTISFDVATAKKLVSMANEQLNTLNDPSVFALKKMLAKDVVALNTADSFNAAALVIKLDTLNQRIAHTPLTPDASTLKRDTPTPKKSHANKEKEKANWVQKMTGGLASLKTLVVIRHTQQATVPLLSPQQQAFLKENITLKLGLAQWAALHHKAALYQTSLKLVQQWLQSYFHNTDGIQTILNELHALEKINVAPALPDLLHSLSTIDNLLTTAVLPATHTAAPAKSKNEKMQQKKPTKPHPHKSTQHGHGA